MQGSHYCDCDCDCYMVQDLPAHPVGSQAQGSWGISVHQYMLEWPEVKETQQVDAAGAGAKNRLQYSSTHLRG
jgi:hypothetical protein